MFSKDQKMFDKNKNSTILKKLNNSKCIIFELIFYDTNKHWKVIHFHRNLFSKRNPLFGKQMRP